VRFFRVTALITPLMKAREEKQLLQFRKQIKQLDLLSLDELGYVLTGKVGTELLFDVLSTASEWQSLVVTKKTCPSSSGPRCSAANGSPEPPSTA
jgi:DNA replication protein DnaC